MSAWTRLPTLRQLTARLRDLNDAFKHPDGGPGSAYLFWEGSVYLGQQRPDYTAGEWVCGCDPWECHVGPEEVPGKDTFDAVAAARRLLADARAKGYR